MFYIIKDKVEEANSNIQSIICTHSLTMIDRAESKCINHVIKDISTNESTIDFLDTENDSDIKEFLNQISEIS
jgi:hypothetical protein